MASSFTVKACAALLAAALVTPAAALPAPAKRQTLSVLTATQISSFKPYTNYASTAYCQPAATLAWNCGANCDANPSFIPVASGGDGELTQFWYVGYDPTLDEIIVGHQGTNTKEILPILEDISIIPIPLDSKLFPGLPSGILAHSGFAGSQERSATDVLAAVKVALAQFGTNKITVTGHSLGAAIGLVDSVFLHLQLPGQTVRFVGYGQPRVANQAFADYIDTLPISVTHVNNMEDFVPILPGRFLGYHHTSGEVHIQDSGSWTVCPGE
ncbi:Lipase [Trametes pubescens]|uniref:Lipase n=1 Tax=Trametes pubescens TaxID=154538 RepID=A0A1M2VCL2_TRAPU|nr:Lipase [Trametes pubescens]